MVPTTAGKGHVERKADWMDQVANYPSLAGKRAYVTGGASGIGAAIVEMLYANEAIVTFCDVDEAAAAALLDQLSDTGDRVQFQHVDVTDISALQSAIRDAGARIGGLDFLVNNVANDTRHTVGELSEADYRHNLAINLDPVVFAAQAAAPLIKAAGGGSIVNFSSLNVLLGPEDMPIYTMAKAGILGLTKSMARSWGRDGMRANAIIPGWVTTPRQKALWMSDEAEAAWRAQCALDIEILPQDVANLVAFLCAEESRAITGQSFVIDAGRT